MKNLALASVLLFSLHAQASIPTLEELGYRLIETSPGNLQWMDETQLMQLSEIQHSVGRCGGFMDVTGTNEMFAITPPAPTPAIDFAKRIPKQNVTVRKFMDSVSKDQIALTVKHLSDGFVTRYYNSSSGVKSSQWIQDQYALYAAGRADVEVRAYGHKWKQPSVIATIHGSGPLKDQHLVVGGHQDSITSYFDVDARAPGADDDASGTATALETFRVLMLHGFKPNRTIHFMAYAGEERGLLGSQVIAQEFRAKQIQVEAVLQFDMTAFAGATEKKLVFINDYIDRDLTTFTEKLVDTYLDVKWAESKCGYACSDHASWNKNGYRSAFPFESTFDAHNSKIHTTGDTAEILDFDFAAQFARLGVAFIGELAQE